MVICESQFLWLQSWASFFLLKWNKNKKMLCVWVGNFRIHMGIEMNFCIFLLYWLDCTYFLHFKVLLVQINTHPPPKGIFCFKHFPLSTCARVCVYSLFQSFIEVALVFKSCKVKTYLPTCFSLLVNFREISSYIDILFNNIISSSMTVLSTYPE